MVKFVKNKIGATIIELVMMVLVLTTITATGVGVIIFFMQLFVYTPRELSVQKIGQELNEMIIEGDQNVRGLRYANNIIDASSTQVSYTYGYPPAVLGQSVRFRWSSLDKKIYRSTSSDLGANWSLEIAIPYHIQGNTLITIDGRTTPGVIFTYKKLDDAGDEFEEEDWHFGSDPLSSIRRVIINIRVKTGSGEFKSFHGSSDLMSAVEIKKVQ